MIFLKHQFVQLIWNSLNKCYVLYIYYIHINQRLRFPDKTSFFYDVADILLVDYAVMISYRNRA